MIGFLLIVRTGRVVTEQSSVAPDTRMSQQIAEFCNRRFGSEPTVIVTAAVYRGLDSRLRPRRT